jgi:uncharacterized protein YbaR (Trm112 family)
MIPADLLDILRCPETRQPLAEAPAETLAGINARIKGEDGLRNRAGETVTEPLTAGLIRADRAVVYPVREGIPILLSEEAILL